MNTKPQLSILVNGTPTQIALGANVADVVTHSLGARSSDGVAVAVNGTVVPRSRWATTDVSADAVVELVTATQGG